MDAESMMAVTERRTKIPSLMSAAIWTRDMRPTRLSRGTPLEPSDSEQRPFWKTISLGKRPTSQPSCLRTNGKARDDGPVASDHVPTTRLVRRMLVASPRPKRSPIFQARIIACTRSC